MKKAFLISSLSLACLSACKKDPVATPEVPAQQVSTVIQEPVISDTLIVQDSVQLTETLTASFNSEALMFENISDKRLLDSIYAPINFKFTNYSSDDLENSLLIQRDKFYDEVKKMLTEWSPEFKQTWSQNSKMQLFSQENDFITLKYASEGYTGGAHGYYNEIYKVFDLKNKRTLQLADLLKVQDPQIWSRILMDNFLKNDLDKNQAQMLLVKNIPLNNNFYFDNQHVYFLYNQYEIAAYAAGPVLIKVPFADIKLFLKSDFQSRINIQ